MMRRYEQYEEIHRRVLVHADTEAYHLDPRYHASIKTLSQILCEVNASLVERKAARSLREAVILDTVLGVLNAPGPRPEEIARLMERTNVPAAPAHHWAYPHDIDGAGKITYCPEGCPGHQKRKDR